MKRTIKLFQICLLMCGVFGVGADEVKSVMEGDSVTLNTDVTEIQGIILIQWSFGKSGSTIAEIDGGKISYPYLTEIFGDRLHLDHQTGSLTIKNMRINDTGLYKLEITRNSGTTPMTFSVTVYESPSVIDAYKAEIKTVSVMEGDSVPLQTDVTETLGDELIVWRFGDEGKLIAKCNIEAKSSQLSDDERFRDRLKLDEKTGSLTITNSRTTDSGLYSVKISSSKDILYKKFSVIISAPGLSPGAVAGIVIGVLLLVLAVAAAAAAVGVIYYRRKISELESQQLKEVSVKEGDDVTLNTDVTEIQSDDLIEWRFGDGGPPIAAIRGGIIEIYETGFDVRFTDRLKLDKTTGSLTITDTRETDYGLYQLMIRQDSKIKYKMFNVSVCENTVSVSVSVNEGDPVTLKTDAELQRDDFIEWTYGYKENLIAEIRRGKISKYDDVTDGRFRGCLELDEKTGSLTITNSEVKHAGVYQLQITSISGVSYKIFTVDLRMRNISVEQGKNMILNSETEIQKDDQIQWRFGDKEILIAELRGGAGETRDDDERFRGRLKVDEKTGSLIIRDITADHPGEYKLQIISSRGTTNMRFVVTVNPRMIFVKEGKLVTLETNTEIQKDDQIQWRFGDKEILLAEVRGGTRKTHDADGRFRDRLKLDEKTGSLIITDLTAEQSGVYKLQIISSRGNTNKRFAITVYPREISATEGESVTLETNTEIQKDDQIQWRFGNILIAEVSGGTGETHDDNGRFRGRLTLDEKTGSLTIARMRDEHTGVYKLQISSSRGNTNKRFRINEVYSGYTSKTEPEGKDVTLSSDTYIVKDEIVKWLFNNKILATGKDGDINKTSYCDERFKDRLELDHETGSLTIKNIRTSDSGVYHLKLSILGIERIFRVSVNVNDSVAVQMPPVNEEDPDVGNEEEGMSLLVMR